MLAEHHHGVHKQLFILGGLLRVLGDPLLQIGHKLLGVLEDEFDLLKEEVGVGVDPEFDALLQSLAERFGVNTEPANVLLLVDGVNFFLDFFEFVDFFVEQLKSGKTGDNSLNDGVFLLLAIVLADDDVALVVEFYLGVGGLTL